RHRSSLGREREQVLYSDLQFLGEAKRHLGVRDVGSRLDSVNGLAAHPYAPRQFRRADTASAPQRGELILNAHRMLAQVQNGTFSARSNTRGSSARVIVPNAAAPKLPFGAVRGGVLARLKTSARNSRRRRSVRKNVFPTIRSTAP